MAEPAWQEPVRQLIEDKLRDDARRIMRNEAQAEHLIFLRWLYEHDGFCEPGAEAGKREQTE